MQISSQLYSDFNIHGCDKIGFIFKYFIVVVKRRFLEKREGIKIHKMEYADQLIQNI